jgi:DNA polymerase IV
VNETLPNPGFCRDCLTDTRAYEPRCLHCRSPRIIRHAELRQLSIAHIDCDAFYAAVEKRDNPALADKAVIVGGGTRGVVSTCCYIARIQGVRSAMPMFKALKLAPDAVVVKPNMAKYSEVGKQVREMMLAVTPAVQPISIDEAFLDLTGTTRLHGREPAKSLAKLILDIEKQIGISASVGLAPNKYLAKVASDLQKPKGFSVIGAAEAKDFLAKKPVGLIWGVGKAFQEKLSADGIHLIGQLQTMERNDLMARYGSMGSRLYYLSRGEDTRNVEVDEESKSISAETTFNTDISNVEELSAILWQMSEKVARRAKREGMEGHTVTLKLKTKDFKSRTRSSSLHDATQLAHRIYDVAHPLLEREAIGPAFRLIGVGISNLQAATHEDYETLDVKQTAQTKAELAIDAIREKFGASAVEKGLSYLSSSPVKREKKGTHALARGIDEGTGGSE